MTPTDAIERGTSETRDGTHFLRFTLRLPHPVPRVWAAVASSEGLRSWLADAEPFEPRIGGAVTLRGLRTGLAGAAADASGTVTAWDVERVAEYTVGEPHSRIRFHLEPPRGDHVVLRFTHEFRGDDVLRLDRLAAWHGHFERLAAALAVPV
ncbi:SRPBCC domain-containing protein [Streptomyces sp. NPDC055749]